MPVYLIPLEMHKGLYRVYTGVYKDSKKGQLALLGIHEELKRLCSFTICCFHRNPYIGGAKLLHRQMICPSILFEAFCRFSPVEISLRKVHCSL